MSRRRSWSRLALLALAGVCVAMIGGLGVFAFFARELPSPDKVVRQDGFATKINNPSFQDEISKALLHVAENETGTGARLQW